MIDASTVFAGLAAAVHFYVFCLESLLWGRAKTNRVFGMSSAQADANRHFAFNQGFYNLFLAVGAAAGLALGIEQTAGQTLVIYSLLSMLLAALVLISSRRKLIIPALIQGVPPLLGLLFLA